MSPTSDPRLEELAEHARRAARNAHAPYSRFRVGAAVRGQRGIYVGTNVENASFGLTLCAERAALAAAVAQGDTTISVLAVACIDADARRGLEEFVPCGACRQWLAELAPSAQILICGKDKIFTLGELLPVAFSLRSGSPPGP